MKKNLTYEEALKLLEDTTRKLEKGELSLDESLKLYEEGMILIRYCNDLLEKAESRVMAVVKNKNTDDQNDQGVCLQPFEVENKEKAE